MISYIVVTEAAPCSVQGFNQTGLRVMCPLNILRSSLLVLEPPRSDPDPDPVVAIGSILTRTVLVLTMPPPWTSFVVDSLSSCTASSSLSTRVNSVPMWNMSLLRRSALFDEPIVGGGCAPRPDALPLSPFDGGKYDSVDRPRRCMMTLNSGLIHARLPAVTARPHSTVDHMAMSTVATALTSLAWRIMTVWPWLLWTYTESRGS